VLDRCTLARVTHRSTCALVALALVGLACGGKSQPRPPIPDAQVAAPPVPRKLLLVSAGNAFLEGALLVIPDPESHKVPDVDQLTPTELDRQVASGSLPRYSAIILDDHTPPALPPSVPLLYFNPVGAHAPFPIRARVAHPRVIAVDDKHPITRWLTFSETRFDDAAIFELDAARGDISLVTLDGGPTIAAGRLAGRRVVACGFTLSTTDLPLRQAFPLLLSNALDWLEGRPERSPTM